MTLPSFLLIGAMKAGTTTLYEELLHVGRIWLPPEKEPNDLTFEAVESPEGLASYRRKFDGCPPGVMAGDASTAYAKRPTYEGVAERARKLLGPEIKIIYMTRDPIRRIVSQYHHLWGLELEQRPINEAVLEDESYVAYSRYDWQLAPWREMFGDENVLVVKFEDFLADRSGQFDRICRFLGVESAVQPSGTHRNASEGALVALDGTLLGRISTSHFYLYRIKPLLPRGLRDKLRALILPKARPMTDKLDDATRQKLVKALSGDALAAGYFGVN